MIDIVIVNWNSGGFLKKCVDSIFKSQNEHLVNKVIVVDNNSNDRSAEGLIYGQKIYLINNKENAGFSKACNQGFAICSARYILLLNPDAMVVDNTLKECVAFMDKNDNIDILGCQLLDDNGKITKTCSRFPTPQHIFYDATGLSKVAPKVFKPGTIMTDWAHDKNREVDQVMGAFMFMRKKIFESIGYFDERFFVYYEEVDFSYRLFKKGGKTYYNKDIKAIHTGEGTTSSVKAFRLFLNLQSRLIYAKKNFSILGFLLVFIATFFIEPFSRLFFLVLKGRPQEIMDVLKGYGLLIKQGKKCFSIPY